jgi:beta-galactosidase
MGVPITFIQESDTFDHKKFPFMIAPAYEMIDNHLLSKWKNYVTNGGHLILTTRSGMKDNRSHLWETLLQQPIRELIGAKVEYFDQLPPAEEAHVAFNENNYAWNVWGDILTPLSGESWVSYSDQFYEGKSCVVKNSFGKGSVYYIGIISKSKELEKQLLRKIYTEAGASILDLPDYVFTEYRNGYWVTVNYTSQMVNAPVHPGKTTVIGSKEVPPGGVTVWK